MVPGKKPKKTKTRGKKNTKNYSTPVHIQAPGPPLSHCEDASNLRRRLKPIQRKWRGVESAFQNPELNIQPHRASNFENPDIVHLNSWKLKNLTEGWLRMWERLNLYRLTLHIGRREKGIAFRSVPQHAEAKKILTSQMKPLHQAFA